MIAENLKSVRQRIAKGCEKIGRTPEDVKLVCVTKETSIDDIKALLELGVKDLGENRVKDAFLKYKTIGEKGINWHLIGHLQTNKAKDAVRIFSLIHSVDSLRLAKELDKEAKKVNKFQDILVQVNVSGERTKFGIVPADAVAFFDKLSLYANLNILGLMTIAPEFNDPEKARPYFRVLRELKDKLNERERSEAEPPRRGQILSMGMSNDFEVAIEEGSNMVRIGRAIFDKRKV